MLYVSSQDLANRLGSGSTWHEGGFPELDADVRSTYTANTTVAGLEVADVILLIGTNPRVESPVYNARIRKSWLDGAQVGQGCCAR
jgi:NADH dehydrogenase (ubiquinone) Fe-S protein 1